MSNQITSVRIKQNDGSYSSEIPIGALASNVIYSDNLSVLDVLGTGFQTNGGTRTVTSELANYDEFKGNVQNLNNQINEIKNTIEDYEDTKILVQHHEEDLNSCEEDISLIQADTEALKSNLPKLNKILNDKIGLKPEAMGEKNGYSAQSIAYIGLNKYAIGFARTHGYNDGTYNVSGSTVQYYNADAYLMIYDAGTRNIVGVTLVGGHMANLACSKLLTNDSNQCELYINEGYDPSYEIQGDTDFSKSSKLWAAYYQDTSNIQNIYYNSTNGLYYNLTEQNLNSKYRHCIQGRGYNSAYVLKKVVLTITNNSITINSTSLYDTPFDANLSIRIWGIASQVKEIDNKIFTDVGILATVKANDATHTTNQMRLFWLKGFLQKTTSAERIEYLNNSIIIDHPNSSKESQWRPRTPQAIGIDAKYMYWVYSNPNTLAVYDLETGKFIKYLDIGEFAGSTMLAGEVEQVAFDESGEGRLISQYYHLGSSQEDKGLKRFYLISIVRPGQQLPSFPIDNQHWYPTETRDIFVKPSLASQSSVVKIVTSYGDQETYKKEVQFGTNKNPFPSLETALFAASTTPNNIIVIHIIGTDCVFSEDIYIRYPFKDLKIIASGTSVTFNGFIRIESGNVAFQTEAAGASLTLKKMTTYHATNVTLRNCIFEGTEESSYTFSGGIYIIDGINKVADNKIFQFKSGSYGSASFIKNNTSYTPYCLTNVSSSIKLYNAYSLLSSSAIPCYHSYNGENFLRVFTLGEKDLPYISGPKLKLSDDFNTYIKKIQLGQKYRITWTSRKSGTVYTVSVVELPSKIDTNIMWNTSPIYVFPLVFSTPISITENGETSEGYTQRILSVRFDLGTGNSNGIYLYNLREATFKANGKVTIFKQDAKTDTTPKVRYYMRSNGKDLPQIDNVTVEESQWAIYSIDLILQ